MKGQIIGGTFGSLVARQKADQQFELGELLIAEHNDTKMLLEVTDVSFGSQISQQHLAMISGMDLEEETKVSFMDKHLRLYNLATLKSVLTITGKEVKAAKILPSFFSKVEEVKKEDISFLSHPPHPLFLGKVRSGSKVIDVPLYVNGRDVLSHHILIPATTGKGKSNLASVMLWDMIDKEYAGVLVLDPHDEYYERLKTHPRKENVVYYTQQPPPGARSLKIHLSHLRPSHFRGVVEWSPAQLDALHVAHKQFGKDWIAQTLKKGELPGVQPGTVEVLKRRFQTLLSVTYVNDELHCTGVFDVQAGESTLHDITTSLSEGKVVIVNTASFSSREEILIGSLISTEVFSRYKKFKEAGTLAQKPVVSILLEEAPRVLGKEVLEKGQNIFSTIAREGRKFQVGLIAITQLPSLIPRSVLANMNTKIILGVEMAPERQAIIESAAQDLSDAGRTIAALDKGEAIITSNFVPFAVPIKIPLFSSLKETPQKRAFPGIQ